MSRRELKKIYFHTSLVAPQGLTKRIRKITVNNGGKMLTHFNCSNLVGIRGKMVDMKPLLGSKYSLDSIIGILSFVQSATLSYFPSEL